MPVAEVMVEVRRDGQWEGEGSREAGRQVERAKTRKSPLGKYHSSNCCKQDLSLNAKISGLKFEEEKKA